MTLIKQVVKLVSAIINKLPICFVSKVPLNAKNISPIINKNMTCDGVNSFAMICPNKLNKALLNI